MEINTVVISICSEKPISTIKNTACRASLNKGYSYFYNDSKGILTVCSSDYIFRIRLSFLEIAATKTLMKMSFSSKSEDLLLTRINEFLYEMNKILEKPLTSMLN